MLGWWIFSFPNQIDGGVTMLILDTGCNDDTGCSQKVKLTVMSVMPAPARCKLEPLEVNQTNKKNTKTKRK